MKREEGYYWCKFLGVWQVLFWSPAPYGGFCFFIPGVDIGIAEDDRQLSQINETRILNPDEK